MRDVPTLGEFEQLVLLATLRLGPGAHAPGIRTTIEQAAGRRVTRGALYATLDRLEVKGFVRWAQEPGSPARGGIPRRSFELTEAGLKALQRSWGAVSSLASGLEGSLEPGS